MQTTRIRDPRERTITSITQVDPKNDAHIVGFAEGRWEKRDQYRNQLEQQWYTNITQYLGYQYHTYDTHTGTMSLSPAPSYRVRLVCNRLMGISRKVVSRALRQRPRWTVLPATNEDRDKAVSKVSEKILRYYWRYLDMDRVVIDAFTWLSITGNVFFRTYWDPQKGPEMDMEDEIPGLPPEILKILGKDTSVNMGDLVVEALSPFEIDVDPECSRLEDATHLIHTKLRNKDYLEQRYGVKGLKPDATDDTVLTRYYERRLQGLGSPLANTGQKNQDEEANSCLTHTVWVNPTKKHPNGWYAVVSGGQVIFKADSLPNPFKKIPYSHVVEIPVPGRFWGTSALEQCIPMQSSYNRGRSQLVENRNLMARPKWFVPKGPLLNNNALTSEPGEVIQHLPGFKPEAWTPPEIPSYALKLLEYDLKDIEDTAAHHEVSQARAPSGVRSGVAIAQLQEQDDQVYAPTFMLAEKALSQIGAWALQLLAKNVSEERVVKLVGDDKAVESMQFTGQSIYGPNAEKPGVNYFDVEVQIGSQLPLSKAARLQFTIDLVNAGILDRQMDRKKIFEILELGYEEEALADSALDKQLAQRENVQLTEDPTIQIVTNPWDNHEVHLETHRRFQKQPEYQDLRAVDPTIDGRFENHIYQHQAKFAAMIAPQMAQPTPEQPAGVDMAADQLPPAGP
jgi:hypothetical protein